MARKAIFYPLSSIARISIAADHSDEGCGDDDRQSHEPVLLFTEQRHFLITTGTDRQNQPASFIELLRERRRNPRGGGGANDRLEGGQFRGSECAVTNEHKHIRDPGLAKILASGVRQVWETLDRHDLIAEPRKNRGLETESGANLQRAVLRFKF